MPAPTDVSASDFSKPDTVPVTIRNSRWYRELEWLQALLENWNITDLNKLSGTKKTQQTRVKETVAFSQIGLCHNDLNPNNILYVPPKPVESSSSSSTAAATATAAAANPSPSCPFTLIDFEYATFNQPQFDLANHFSEYALDYTVKNYPFFESKHTDNFMTQEQMMTTLKAYAEEKRATMVSTCVIAARSRTVIS